MQSVLMSPCGSDGKSSSANTGDVDLIPGLGRSPGKGNGNPLQYSCLENPRDRGAWRAAVHRVAKSQTQLKRLSMHAQCELISKYRVSKKVLQVKGYDQVP